MRIMKALFGALALVGTSPVEAAILIPAGSNSVYHGLSLPDAERVGSCVDSDYPPFPDVTGAFRCNYRLSGQLYKITFSFSRAVSGSIYNGFRGLYQFYHDGYHHPIIDTNDAYAYLTQIDFTNSTEIYFFYTSGMFDSYNEETLTGYIYSGLYSNDYLDIFDEGNNFTLRDDVYLTISIAAVPEPAIWAVLVLGFGVVGAGMRGRKLTFRMPGVKTIHSAPEI